MTMRINASHYYSSQPLCDDQFLGIFRLWVAFIIGPLFRVWGVCGESFCSPAMASHDYKLRAVRIKYLFSYPDGRTIVSFQLNIFINCSD